MQSSANVMLYKDIDERRQTAPVPKSLAFSCHNSHPHLPPAPVVSLRMRAVDKGVREDASGAFPHSFHPQSVSTPWPFAIRPQIKRPGNFSCPRKARVMTVIQKA